MSPGPFGARVRRSSDPRLLTGRGAYVDDLKLAGMLHMAVWRSPLAHARVERVDLDRARALSGVIDAFDLTAFGPAPPSFPVVLTHESLKPCPQYPLAKDRVRYVGEGAPRQSAIARRSPAIPRFSVVGQFPALRWQQ